MKTPREYEASKSLIHNENSGGATRSRTGLDGFAIRCITALLSRRLGICQIIRLPVCRLNSNKKGKPQLPFLVKVWSGKRDSNSRPQPWQGCALPTELFPHRHGPKTCLARLSFSLNVPDGARNAEPQSISRHSAHTQVSEAVHRLRQPARRRPRQREPPSSLQPVPGR